MNSRSVTSSVAATARPVAPAPVSPRFEIDPLWPKPLPEGWITGQLACNEQVHILDHASGAILSSFGRPGHRLGNFTHGHSLAVDSRGNIYVADTNWGRRVQKFRRLS